MNRERHGENGDNNGKYGDEEADHSNAGGIFWMCQEEMICDS